MDKWDTRFMAMTYEIAKWSSCARPGRAIGCISCLTGGSGP